MRQHKESSAAHPQQNERWLGVWIRQNRLQKNWSQTFKLNWMNLFVIV